MELTPRKKAIIGEIVKAHIETGEPIGSKILATRLEGSPSSATLRNEMSELCDMGYLEQPHTSAGRVPTSKAYRLYVTELMGKQKLSDESKQIIDHMLSSARHDPESLGASAAEILSNLTGLPTISVPSSYDGVRLKKVSLMPMGKEAAIIFVVTDDGRTRSRLVRSSSQFTPSLVKKFEDIAAQKICTVDASRLDMPYLQGMVASAGMDALTIAPLLSCVFDMAAELKNAQIKLGGTANLFSVCRGDNEARRIIDLLGTNEAVYSILSRIDVPVGVLFGDDTNYIELKPTGMIVASYGEDREFGRIAVIGPTRMAYERILPSVEYLAYRVGNIMSEVLKGLEE